jgi:hypothetical protein
MTVSPFDLPVVEIESIDPLQVAQDIASLRRSIAAQQEELAERMDTLDFLYAQGVVPKQFDASGMTFLLIAGKTSYDWSSVPEVKEAEASLKAFKAECQQAGTVACTVGKPSWRLSEAKGQH